MLKSFFSSRLAISVVTILALVLYTTAVYKHGGNVMKDKLVNVYNEAVKDKEEKILKLKNDLIAERQAGITANEQLNNLYREKLDEKQKEFNAAISDLESDNFRLRVNIGEGDPIETRAVVSAAPQSCDDGNRTTYLPKETSRFLIREATSANGVVEKLTACQNTVKLYLELVSKYNESIAGVSDER